MDNALLLSLSKQMVMRRTMDIIANNLANMNTTAFKRESVLFESFTVPVESVDESGNTATENLTFVRDYGVVRDLIEGHLQTTASPLDIAIKGDGFFVIGTEEGERYTRDGHFRRDPEGQIVTNDGNPLLDDSGNPIVLSTEETSIKIAEDGTVSTELGVRGKVAVVTFDNTQDMQKTGAGLYSTEQAAKPADGSTIMQGMLESSNVQPIVEMTHMIETMRAYQASSELLSTNEDMVRRAIQKLGEVKV